MNTGGTRSQLWVKFAITAGILLGLALLVQTISTYFFVYDKLVGDEAFREAERQETALIKLAAQSGVKDARQLSNVLAELVRDSPRQLAWIRVVNPQGDVLAMGGTPLTKAPSEEQLLRQLQQHITVKRVIDSKSGKILDAVLRFRLSGPPPPLLPVPPQDRFGPPPNLRVPGGRDGPTFVEVAIYQEGVSVSFSALRRNLVIGCLAALVLLASMISIGFLFARDIRARQLEQQIELARTVQTELLPSSQKPLSPLVSADFSAIFVPAATVGGDFYDIFTSDEGQTSLVLGDVAGKGISAALLMGVVHGAIRSMDWTRSGAKHEESTVRLNQFLCEKTARERFASLFWASFTPETNILRYINAGHLPPLLIRNGTGGDRVTERLQDGGPVLGLLPSAKYRYGETPLDAGDLLIVFSDGIAEAMNKNEEEFGEERIVQIAQRNIGRHPRQICDAIVSGISAFLGPLKPHDDQTLLVVRLIPVGAERIQAQVSNMVS
jgi:alkylated DNA nucleotide flippase Atl1